MSVVHLGTSWPASAGIQRISYLSPENKRKQVNQQVNPKIKVSLWEKSCYNMTIFVAGNGRMVICHVRLLCIWYNVDMKEHQVSL